jgi:hypothetical protein
MWMYINYMYIYMYTEFVYGQSAAVSFTSRVYKVNPFRMFLSKGCIVQGQFVKVDLAVKCPYLATCRFLCLINKSCFVSSFVFEKGGGSSTIFLTYFLHFTTATRRK